MIDCKITENYLNEKSRMCKGIHCRDCELDGNCEADDIYDIQKNIDAVQQWSDTHPPKTYLSDFLEKYPKAILDTDGTPPDVCVNALYDTDACTSNCKACWNQPIKEIPSGGVKI